MEKGGEKGGKRKTMKKKKRLPVELKRPTIVEVIMITLMLIQIINEILKG